VIYQLEIDKVLEWRMIMLLSRIREQIKDIIILMSNIFDYRFIIIDLLHTFIF